MKQEFPHNENVEVVMKKIMPYEKAVEMLKSPKTIGWFTRIYQVGFSQEGPKKPLEIEIENTTQP